VGHLGILGNLATGHFGDVGAAATSFIVTRNQWRDEMIKRGVARYNWQTGKWEWGEPYENRDAPKVLEKLATSDKATIVVERLTDGKMRVTSNFWDGGKVILRDQLLEASNGDGRLHVPRKPNEGTRRSSATIRMARARA